MGIGVAAAMLPISAIFRLESDAQTAVQQINTWVNQKTGLNRKPGRPKSTRKTLIP
jgi:hypothetical protein